MKKLYTFDLEVLKERELSIEELFTLISLNDEDLEYKVTEECKESLQEKGFIKIISEENIRTIITREKGKLLLEECLTARFKQVPKQVTRRSTRSINNDLDEFIVDFRNLWKGLKPGSMGSLNGCKDKMSRWMKDNPSYTKEDIMKAAKAYIKSTTDFKYLQQSDYFIYKQDKGGESSRLSAFIDEIDQPEDEWSTKLS